MCKVFLTLLFSVLFTTVVWGGAYQVDRDENSVANAAIEKGSSLAIESFAVTTSTGNIILAASDVNYDIILSNTGNYDISISSDIEATHQTANTFVIGSGDTLSFDGKFSGAIYGIASGGTGYIEVLRLVR